MIAPQRCQGVQPRSEPRDSAGRQRGTRSRKKQQTAQKKPILDATRVTGRRKRKKKKGICQTSHKDNLLLTLSQARRTARKSGANRLPRHLILESVLKYHALRVNQRCCE